MALSWGPAVNTPTNGMRVGIDLSVAISGVTATITHRMYLWTKRSAFGSSASYSRGGNFGSGSGSFSFNHANNTSDWPTSNRTLIGTWTTTRTLQYGSTQSVSATGSVSGVSAVPGTASHSQSVTVPARGINPPAAPTGAFVYPQSGYTAALLEWTRHHSSAGPVEKVQVQRRHIQENGDFSQWATRANLGGTATSYTDAVAGNWHYHYRVRSGNAAGWSDWLDMGRFNTTPGAQQNVAAARTASDDVLVSWANNVRIPFGQVRTEVQHSANGGAWTTVANLAGRPTSWTHASPNLAQTHLYRVRVIATEWGSAVGAWSTASNTVQLAAAPAAPTGLGPTSPTPTSVSRTLYWKHNATDGTPQTRYQWRYRRSTVSTWTSPAAVTSGVSEHAFTPAFSFFGAGTVVEWQVRTWGAHPDPSPWSSTATFLVADQPTVAINAPGPVVDRSSVRAEWGYDEASGSPQSGWRVTLTADGQVVRSHSGSGTTSSRMLSGLANDTTYELRVAVRSGLGIWSVDDVLTFTTDFVPPQPPTVQVLWDLELGAAVVLLEQPIWDGAYAQPDHHQLWRAINGGEWVLVADEVPLGSAVLDPIPAIGDGTVNTYRAVTVSVLPSSAAADDVELRVSANEARGWAYLNAGPAMATVCRIRANLRRDDDEGRLGELVRFAGRTKRVPFSGTSVDVDWSLSARVAPNPDGGATKAELVDLQVQYGDLVVYRDATGVRRFGQMGKVGSSWEGIVGEASWSMSEIDYVEGLEFEPESAP